MRQRGHGDAWQAARVDPVKGRQGNIYVEGKTMEGDAAVYGNAKAAQFTTTDPDAVVEGISPGAHPPMRRGAQHDFFQPFHIAGHTPWRGPQVHNGISHQLPRAMKSYVAATFYLQEGNSRFLQKDIGDLKVFPVRPGGPG
jgi:hypothetical protein